MYSLYNSGTWSADQSINVMMNAGSAEPLCPYLY